MSKTYNLKCTKCQTSYPDTDPDPYLCAPCKAERMAIARQIDAKMANRPKERQMSDLELFDSTALQFKGQDGRMISFLDARPKRQNA